MADKTNKAAGEKSNTSAEDESIKQQSSEPSKRTYRWGFFIPMALKRPASDLEEEFPAISRPSKKHVVNVCDPLPGSEKPEKRTKMASEVQKKAAEAATFEKPKVSSSSGVDGLQLSTAPKEDRGVDPDLDHCCPLPDLKDQSYKDFKVKPWFGESAKDSSRDDRSRDFPKTSPIWKIFLEPGENGLGDLPRTEVEKVPRYSYTASPAVAQKCRSFGMNAQEFQVSRELATRLFKMAETGSIPWDTDTFIPLTLTKKLEYMLTLPVRYFTGIGVGQITAVATEAATAQACADFQNHIAKSMEDMADEAIRRADYLRHLAFQQRVAAQS